jgi:hypothetical protein
MELVDFVRSEIEHFEAVFARRKKRKENTCRLWKVSLRGRVMDPIFALNLLRLSQKEID